VQARIEIATLDYCRIYRTSQAERYAVLHASSTPGLYLLSGKETDDMCKRS